MTERLEPLPPAVRRMGWLHFWNDFTLDFVSPLLPKAVGAAWLGVMEGVADALGQILKLFTGRASDRSGRRVPWVRAGYGVNAAARPLIAVGLWALWPFWVVGCRLLDRVGKGLRGSSADAFIADWTTEEQRPRAYARMRVMDHLGATLGASAAAAAAWAAPDRLAIFVALLAVPALMQLVLVARLSDAPSAAPKAPKTVGWWPASPPVRRDVFLLGAAAFARLSPLLLLASVAIPSKEGEGWPVWKLCAAWAAIGLAQAVVADLAGRAAGRWGSRSTVVASWIVLAVAYAGAVFLEGPGRIVAAAVAATLAGAAEGTEKALVSQRVDASERGTAFGFYTLVVAGAGLAGNAAFGATLVRAGASPWLPYWPAAAALLFAALIALQSRQGPPR
jgi:MFS family permease